MAAEEIPTWGRKRFADPPENLPSPSMTTVPTTSLSPNASLANLPDDALRTIFSFLPAIEVARVARTCSLFRRLADDPVLWMTLFYCDFDSMPADDKLVDAAPKRCYMKRVLLRRKRSAAAAERRRVAAELALAARRQSGLGAMCNAFHIITFLAAPFVLVLVWLALVFQRLDEGSGGRQWAVVFIPIWLWIALLALATGVYVFMQCKRSSPETSVFATQHLRLRWTPVAAVYESALRSSHLGAIHATILVTLLGLAVFTIVLKLEGVGGDDYNWGAAFLPIWCAAALYFFATCCGWPVTPNTIRAHVSAWTFLVLPALVVCILLAISLDNPGIIALHWVFFPLWLILGLLGLCLLLSFVSMGWQATRAGESRAQMCSSLVPFIVFASVLYVPPVLFLVLLTSKVEGAIDISWLRIGGPLLFITLLGALVSLSWCVGASLQLVVLPLSELWTGGRGDASREDGEAEGGGGGPAAAV